MIRLKKAASISNLSDNYQPVKNVLMVAGEVSGDLHGSNLVKAMQRLDPGIRFCGLGGEKMAQAGVEILMPASKLAVIGIFEVLSKSFSIIDARFKLNNHLKKQPPDLLILIDYPGFNLPLAQRAKKNGLKVLYYISPQIWAWRRGRLKKISKVVDRMAVILPFEKDFYQNSGIKVEYVGHPLLDHIPEDNLPEDNHKDNQLQKRAPIIGVLPGSRIQEIKRLLPVMIKALEMTSPHYPDMKIILPLSTMINDELIELVNHFLRQTALKIHILRQDLHQALKGCDLALVTSGTATLETAIMEIPMIIVYRVSLLSSWIGKMVVKVPYIGLVNLVAGREVVPEFVQNEVTPQKLADEIISILQNSEKREEMVRDLRRVKEMLGGPGASERTARIALDMVEDRS